MFKVSTVFFENSDQKPPAPDEWPLKKDAPPEGLFYLRPFTKRQHGMKTKAQRIVQRMYDNDPFSQWLGIEVLEVGEGFCRLRMEVRQEMLNGFGIAHGGITYSLADSAFAFASNSHGRHAVSIETGISHTRAVQTGDVLLAEAHVQHLSNRLGVYEVQVRREDGPVVGLFKGTVFRKDRQWQLDAEED